ncbi:hypothetical protein BJV82DRAFT_593447 [Fennellomyces sp. T-0311]|nr:hypothetical protein BJV82DRAFT_593447 [Fennellomyces sp. T-0311]
MSYCQRCGELCLVADKCKKCGNALPSTTSSPSSSVLRTPKIDRWQSSYLGSFMGLDSVLSPPSVDDNTTPISSPSSTSSSSLLNRSRRSTLTSLWDSNKRVAPSPRPPVANSNKKRCPECDKPLSGKTVRLPDSPLRYHWTCLQCTHCREPFEDTSFYTDHANRIYHPKCLSMFNRNCSRCSTEIKDAYLMIHNRAIHAKCFRCSSCQKVLQPSSVYTDAKTTAFCQPCSTDKLQLASRKTKIVPQLHPPPASLPITDSMERLSLGPCSGGNSQASSPSPSSPASPTMPSSGGIKPSSLMSRRARPLPKFGSRKVCAGCCQTIVSVHEEKPGPRATRWHTKCLCCRRCSKALDSAAVVHESVTGGLDPWCTICLLVKKKEDGVKLDSAKTIACER